MQEDKFLTTFMVQTVKQEYFDKVNNILLANGILKEKEENSLLFEYEDKEILSILKEGKQFNALIAVIDDSYDIINPYEHILLFSKDNRIINKVKKECERKMAFFNLVNDNIFEETFLEII